MYLKHCQLKIHAVSPINHNEANFPFTSHCHKYWVWLTAIPWKHSLWCDITDYLKETQYYISDCNYTFSKFMLHIDS